MSAIMRAKQKIEQLQREADWQRSAEMSSPRPAAQRAARRAAQECERQIRALRLWIANINGALAEPHGDVPRDGRG